jgi:hypothetical protein
MPDHLDFEKQLRIQCGITCTVYQKDEAGQWYTEIHIVDPAKWSWTLLSGQWPKSVDTLTNEDSTWNAI